MAERTLAPLEVFALDEGMNRRTGSIPYKSLRWVRRYKEPGEFEMTVPADVFDPSWAYICCDDRPETGIVQKVHYADDAQTYAGVDSVTVSGYFLESALNNIVFLAEAPEQKKVYVPMPRRPLQNASTSPKIWSDTLGGWYYSVGPNEVVDAKTGRHSTADGLKEVEYKEHFTTAGGHPAYDYYESDGSLVQVDWNGAEKRLEPLFEDYRGNVWYRDGKEIGHAVGVADKRSDTWRIRKKRWDALPDDDPYGRYYMETVKGPWQRTEAMEPVTEGDSVDVVFRWARRMMGDWVRYEEPRIKGVVKKVDPSFQRLGDLMYSTLYEVGASLRLEYLFERNVFVLSAYRGKDRTQGQDGNPWAVFSDTWGTLSGFEAWRDTSGYKNACYTLYEYDAPKDFDASGWPVAGFIHAIDDASGTPTLYGIRHEAKRGYLTDKVGEPGEAARETYLDLRGEKPSCDKDWSRDVVEIPTGPAEDRRKAIEEAEKKFAKPADAYDMRAVYAAYEADLKTRGKAFLASEYPVDVGLETGTLDPSRYLRDWDLGDKVDLEVSALGISKRARVVEVEESYDCDGSDVALTLGEEEPSPVR